MTDEKHSNLFWMLQLVIRVYFKLNKTNTKNNKMEGRVLSGSNEWSCLYPGTWLRISPYWIWIFLVGLLGVLVVVLAVLVCLIVALCRIVLVIALEIHAFSDPLRRRNFYFPQCLVLIVVWWTLSIFICWVEALRLPFLKVRTTGLSGYAYFC